MERVDRLLLDVWREACRHIQIERSTAAIAPILVRCMPLDLVLVQRFDPSRSGLQTVATGPGEMPQPGPGQLRACTPAQMRRVLAWARTGRIEHRRGSRKPEGVLAILLEELGSEDWLAGPLSGDGGPIGTLLARAVASRAFGPAHRQVFAALLEPFSVALENDRRLREMTTLREAAEADRRSLLTRLGRSELVETIVGAEQGLRAVMQRVELVARSDVPVLLLGETGSGKEVVARAIHSRSARRAGPFIRVNCGAIPSELIDSELFGHERGSFTGAVATRQGWFERADGGTLLLDEIGELPLAAQVRLLRILQDHRFERVGGHETRCVDVRIIAATHRDLAAMVQHGRFREDLWYRVAVFPIVIPPLREHPDDIPALARHFAQRAATRFGLAPQMPGEQDIAALCAYHWPGNVRELATVIDRAAILGDGRGLEVLSALGGASVLSPAGPLAAGCEPPASAAGARRGDTMSPVPPPAPAAARHDSLADVMRRHIEAALMRSHGRIEGPFGAARALEVNPQTLRARMRKLAIDWRRFRAPPA